MAFVRFFLPPAAYLLLGGVCLRLAAASTLPFPAPRRIMPAYRRVFDQARRVTRIPIVLPTTIPGKFYCSVDTLTASEYDIDIDLTPGCHGSTPCTIGSISGMKSRSSAAYGTVEHPMETSKDAYSPNIPVTLAHGIKGYYSESRVGYPSFVYWNRSGYSYAAGLKGSQADLVRMANSAILNGDASAGDRAHCQSPPLHWKPFSAAPAALIYAYRTAGGVSDPSPTLKDVRAARFLRVQEPGRTVPLFLVDPQQEDLSGSGGSLLVGFVPVGRAYRQVMAETSRWSAVVFAADLTDAKRQAARGNVSVLRQRTHGLPVLFFPEAGLHLPMHPERFDGKWYTE